VIIFFIEPDKLFPFEILFTVAIEGKKNPRINQTIEITFVESFFLKLEMMHRCGDAIESTESEQSPLPSEGRDDTLTILEEKIPPDFEYEYDSDRQYFVVINLEITNRIANLQILCDLLARNSVRIAVLNCTCNLTPHIF
jgi:hypothetical protein